MKIIAYTALFIAGAAVSVASLDHEKMIASLRRDFHDSPIVILAKFTNHVGSKHSELVVTETLKGQGLAPGDKTSVSMVDIQAEERDVPCVVFFKLKPTIESHRLLSLREGNVAHVSVEEIRALCKE